MAVGKQSLGRVAQSGVIGATSPQVMAHVEKTVAAPEEKPVKKTAAKETAATKSVAKPAASKAKTVAVANKIYAVGDKLPEYLL